MKEYPPSDAASAIESILFVHGEPLAEKTMAQILDVSPKEIAAGLAELRRRLTGRGLTLIEKENAWQLVTHPDCAAAVDALMWERHQEALSRAALETLSIVAYKGPMTRADIDYIRGVNSSFALRTLLMRGLVERGENEKDARSFLYAVGFDFMKYLGIARLEDLPEYASLRGAAEPESSAAREHTNEMMNA